MTEGVILYYVIDDMDIDEVYGCKNLDEAYHKLAKHLCEDIGAKEVICLAEMPEFYALLSINDLKRLLTLENGVLFLAEENYAFYALVLHSGVFFGLHVGEWDRKEQKDIDKAIRALEEAFV